MRVFLALGLLTIVSLSGCSGTGGLGAYLVQPSDLPAECKYMSLEDPGLKFLVDDHNLTGNPGSTDNDIWTQNFGDEGATAINNRLAAFDCSDGDDLQHVYSLAIQFSDANATAGYDYAGDCDYIDDGGSEFALVKGATLAFVEINGENATAVAHELIQRLSTRMGIPNPCLENASPEE